MDFNDIFREYYEKILNFCYAKIGNRQLAEDCVQEVFLALSRKMHSLRLDTNIAAWLYGAAKNEIKRCLRKNITSNISIDDLEDIPQSGKENERLFEDIISDEEYGILKDYYLDGEDISKLAADRRVSNSAMYQRIHRIKQKILESSDKSHNLSKK